MRSQIIFSNTMFRAVCYRPDECQIITTGTDRKIGYWETYDGSQIRELDGSKTASINGMDIQGKYFVTGGGDNIIKVYLVCMLHQACQLPRIFREAHSLSGSLTVSRVS